jgi:molybdenum cofactor biosynthesis enzyme MoaA
MAESTYSVKIKPGRMPLWNGRKPRLGRLDMELTERCNNDCLHCCINLPANDLTARAREMTTEQIKDILRQAADLGFLEVRFTGGEPLLRSDFQELYLYARRLGMKVLLFTNACLITPSLADLLARIPPLVPIEISVYGMRRESYEAVTRAPGSFAQFRRGVNLLLKHKVRFVLKSVLLPQNRHETDEYEAWAGTIPGMIGPPGYTVFLGLRNRRDDADRNALICSLRASQREVLAMLTRGEAKYRREMAEFASKFMGPPGDTLFGCGAGHGVCIDAYGCAQPCMSMRAPELTVALAAGPRFSLPEERESASIGSPAGRETGEGTLAYALFRFSKLRDMRATNPEYLRSCAGCFLKGLCEQCPAKSWVEHGVLDAPISYLCEMAHAQARYLGWLGANEHGWEVMDWRERVSKQSSVRDGW